MLKKYLSPTNYWQELSNAHKNNYESLRTILLNDRGAVGIVAALLIGINLASIPATVKTDTSPLGLACLLFHTSSAMTALISLWLGTQQYLKINMLLPYQAFHYKMGMKWFDEPIGYLVFSILLMPLGFVCGVFLSYAKFTALVVAGIVGWFLLFGILLVSRSALKYHHAIGVSEPIDNVSHQEPE